MTPREFEEVAREAMSRMFATSLNERMVGDFPKRWDFLSQDLSIVGDAKYLTLVRGVDLPPAKFMEIAAHVWLLEKIEASHRFLVFGNQIEVPRLWLRKYGRIATPVEFYFSDDSGKVTRLR